MLSKSHRGHQDPWLARATGQKHRRTSWKCWQNNPRWAVDWFSSCPVFLSPWQPSGSPGWRWSRQRHLARDRTEWGFGSHSCHDWCSTSADDDLLMLQCSYLQLSTIRKWWVSFEISKKIQTVLLVTSCPGSGLKPTESASLGWEHSFGSKPSNQIRARHIWQIDLGNIFREKNVSDYGAMILIELHLIDNFFQTLSLKHNLGQYLQYSPLLLTFLNFCARNWLSKQIQKDKKLTNPFFPDPNTPLTHFNDYKAEFEE